jgi:uncharacterized protein (TIGR00290 family)
MKQPILFCWSGGKDSALALYELQRTGEYEVAALLTTVTADYDRISMHGVRRALLHEQAAALGLPLHEVFISKQSSNAEYEAEMGKALQQFRERGVETVAFGDIFLEDLREYREGNLARVGMRAVFPIWKRDTRELVRTFLDLGFSAVTTCIDGRVLEASFAGRTIDERFLSDLPPGVDPCGENGEFHSFVFTGPNLARRISFEVGETIARDSFFFCDLVPHGQV